MYLMTIIYSKNHVLLALFVLLIFFHTLITYRQLELHTCIAYPLHGINNYLYCVLRKKNRVFMEIIS